MALNNYYPFNNPYQPQYVNPYLQQQQQMVQPQQAPQMLQTSQPSICWVSGDREAAAYPVAPNNAVALWSQSEPVVYLKQADATGKPAMKIYDLVERMQTAQPAGEEKPFATKEDLDHLREEIVKLKSEISKKKAPVKRHDEEDDE